MYGVTNHLGLPFLLLLATRCAISKCGCCDDDDFCWFSGGCFEEDDGSVVVGVAAAFTGVLSSWTTSKHTTTAASIDWPNTLCTPKGLRWAATDSPGRPIVDVVINIALSNTRCGSEINSQIHRVAMFDNTYLQICIQRDFPNHKIFPNRIFYVRFKCELQTGLCRDDRRRRIWRCWSVNDFYRSGRKTFAFAAPLRYIYVWKKGVKWWGGHWATLFVGGVLPVRQVNTQYTQ